MAKGRMINSKICEDPRVVRLCDAMSKLAFTWLITFTDRDGRVSGEPRRLVGMLFPCEDGISAQTLENYMREWAEAGLIIWYEVDGIKHIQFPGFQKNQANLRYDREPSSTIPPPTPDGCRMVAGSLSENGWRKIREEKIKSPGGILPEQQEEWFKKFWEFYPRHDGGLVPARCSWGRLNVDPGMYSAIMAGLAICLKSPQWTRDKGAYIPHATTWLNQRRWEGLKPTKKVWSDI